VFPSLSSILLLWPWGVGCLSYLYFYPLRALTSMIVHSRRVPSLPFKVSTRFWGSHRSRLAVVFIWHPQPPWRHCLVFLLSAASLPGPCNEKHSETPSSDWIGGTSHHHQRLSLPVSECSIYSPREGDMGHSKERWASARQGQTIASAPGSCLCEAIQPLQPHSAIFKFNIYKGTYTH
jgi:hypothetical protein